MPSRAAARKFDVIVAPPEVLRADGIAADTDIWFPQNFAWQRGRRAISDLLTNTRATPQTGITSAGLLVNFADNEIPNVPGVGVELPEARENLLTRSGDLTHAAWIKTRTTAPAAGSLVEDGTASSTHFVQQSSTKAASALTYTRTVRAAPNGRNWIGLQANDGSNAATAYFNLGSGVVGTKSANGSFVAVSSTIAPLADGSYLCSFTYTTPATTVNHWILFLATGDGGVVYSGDNASDVLLSGMNHQLGGFATPEIATVGSSASRNLNQLRYASATYQSLARGSAHIAFKTTAAGAISVERWIWVKRVDADNYIGLKITSGNKLEFIVVSSSSTVVQKTSTNSVAANTSYAAAIAWDTNDCNAAFTAALETNVFAADTDCVMPTGAFTTEIGHFNATLAGNVIVQRISEWPFRISDAALDLKRAA